MDISSLASLTRSVPSSKSDYSGRKLESGNAQPYLQKGLRHVETMNARGLYGLLEQASIALPPLTLLEQIVSPMLGVIGERWQSGKMRIVHEHMASSVIQTFLQESVYARTSEEPLAHIAMATPTGQQCNLGLLMAAVVAADNGWLVHYFGTDLPAEELAAAALAKQVQAVAISVVCHDGGIGYNKQIKKLSNALEGKSRLFIGGRATDMLDMDSFVDGVIRVGSLSQFSAILSEPTSILVK
jgi:methanogenic corrinoid protein MtbC1